MNKSVVTLCCFLICVFALCVERLSADVLVDIRFDHLLNDADGLTSDGQLCVDSSGNGYHGFCGGGSGAAVVYGSLDFSGAIDISSNNVYVILRDGRVTSGHGESGIDDPITTPSPYFTLEADKGYTFEAVLKWDPSSSDSRHGIMGLVGDNEFWFREDNGFLEYVFGDGSNRVGSSDVIDVSSIINDDKWHHIALVVDKATSEIRTYVDRQLLYTDTDADIANLGQILSGTDDFRIGAYNTNSSNRFDGCMDRVVISEQALGIDRFVVPEIILNVSFEHLAYDVDGLTSEGQLCIDSSGNGYHGFYRQDDGLVAQGVAAGSTSLDTASNDAYVILQDGLAFTGHGEPDVDDPVTTLSPYFLLEADKGYTFEAVLKWDPSSPDSIHGIMGMIGDNEFWVRENAGYLQYVFDDGPDRVSITSPTIDISSAEEDGRWHHLAVVLDRAAQEIRCYLDFQLIHTNSNPSIADLDDVMTGTDDFRLGAYNERDDNRFDGQMDHFVITGRALAQDEFIMYDYVVVEPVAVDLLPGNHAVGVDPAVVLSWLTNLEGTYDYDVYFGTNPESLLLVSELQSEKYFDPLGIDELQWNTKYYWRVDVRNQSKVSEGMVYDFVTTKPWCTAPLAGDADGDCIVDFTDLLILLEQWL